MSQGKGSGLRSGLNLTRLSKNLGEIDHSKRKETASKIIKKGTKTTYVYK